MCVCVCVCVCVCATKYFGIRFALDWARRGSVPVGAIGNIASIVTQSVIHSRLDCLYCFIAHLRCISSNVLIISHCRSLLLQFWYRITFFLCFRRLFLILLPCSHRTRLVCAIRSIGCHQFAFLFVNICCQFDICHVECLPMLMTVLIL